ncbi:HDOD domain-containing protein [Pleionea sp. CnH1-48]|uniref:HDOD domain-containing protein n=1 Tax=Pleionea sp. CnH1-48 TaxID=2954494 RepID=UPI0020975352|nr:HDOD domain-containing protein [Pleionea sp. CnH1-48]MCO7222890.1 HDOD domain-containing protein [Pleionea sp. CnH1-48]
MKPSDSPLVQKIDEAIDEKRILLPSFPEQLIKVRQALADPELPIKPLVKIIHTDPALVGRILSIADSAAYHIPVNDLSLFQVIQKLGVGTIRSVVYNHCLSQLFNDRRFKKVNEIASWARNESLEVGAISFVLARQYDLGDPSTALLAGLIHNVGALVVIAYLAHQNSMVLTFVQQQKLIRHIQGYFSIKVISDWNLPEPLKAVAEYQNQPSYKMDKPMNLAHLVSAAQWINRSFKITELPAVDEHLQHAFESLRMKPQLSQEDKDEIMEQMIAILKTIR